MKEELPEEEWKRDKIQAKMLTWGACHQRQDSVNYSDLRTGLFTRVWLEALQKDTDETPLKVGELFDTVSKETMEKAKGESNYWQYVQLWTSSVDGTISAQLQAST
ncbi:unnamed protein product [Rhizoctonia solani]|uniref:Uncharacterized protein n=1 Tax=Rhizoctonia solani TaxID=456999 RepID=A0A8H3E778_9AGAM|nr:unnamed protein product [Rhizoctonia solani]